MSDSHFDPKLLEPSKLTSPWFPVGSDSVRLLCDGVQAFPAMLEAIAAAKREILLEMYWIGADRSVRNALFRAVARGVSVRVLVPAESDVQVVQFAQHALFDTLLRHGVQIYALAPPMLHSKTAIIDDHFCTIGSYNLDERSWRKNLELNLAVEDLAFARHVRDQYDRDVTRAHKVDLHSWRGRSVARRGAEWVAWALRELW